MELVSVATLLRDAREQVRPEARAKAIDVVVVGVEDEVFVDHAQIVRVAAAMLREAIRTVPPRGRVAVTAQEMERELVIAVFDSGQPRVTSCDELAANVPGGRAWMAEPSDGNLTLFAVGLTDSAGRSTAS